MALTDSYVLPVSRIPDIFSKIRDGQAPERLSHQLLKDWGFTSSNDKAFVGLLKSLGFLTSDGKPTQRYLDYRDHSRSKQIMAEALHEAYSDLFLIKERPSASDRDVIEGKFKSFHNVSDNVAGLMAKTFLALLPLADFTDQPQKKPPPEGSDPTEAQEVPRSRSNAATPSLHYNVQVHLPATKDIEVYNAIFKSLRTHLFDK